MLRAFIGVTILCNVVCAAGCRARRGSMSHIERADVDEQDAALVGRVSASVSAREGGSSDAPPPQAASAYRVEMRWDPQTGRGDVIQHAPGGDMLRTCFHCDFPGYTGALAIGSFSQSGYGYYPAVPVRGFRAINLFCAQDESIWDKSEKAEYTYGWSENFGTGPDGHRLEYRRGRILQNDDRAVVLESENQGGCYGVQKIAYTRPEARFWILATRIENRCDHRLRFDFFSGDDPWVGTYAASDGDVGWTPEGIVRHERVFGLGRFTAGGMYDLGNSALGESEQAFSNQGDFIVLDPATPLPDFSAFANRFAHSSRDVDAAAPLDNRTLTALNLGWRDQMLEPGQGLTLAFALGMAVTGEPGSIPALPPIKVTDWSVWRKYLREGNERPPTADVRFAAETVELDLNESQLIVRGDYVLRNPADFAQALVIEFPIAINADRPSPETMTVDGEPVAVVPISTSRVAGRFPITVPPLGLHRFEIAYTQHHRARRAGYVVTTGREWSGGVGHAVFKIRHPSSMAVSPSYAATYREQDTRGVTQWIVRQPFMPDRELELAW